jgi:hypothetical protein
MNSIQGIFELQSLWPSVLLTCPCTRACWEGRNSDCIMYASERHTTRSTKGSTWTESLRYDRPVHTFFRLSNPLSISGISHCPNIRDDERLWAWFSRYWIWDINWVVEWLVNENNSWFRSIKFVTWNSTADGYFLEIMGRMELGWKWNTQGIKTLKYGEKKTYHER